MKRIYLRKLGLEESVIDLIMKDYGESVEKLKLKYLSKITFLEEQMNELTNCVKEKSIELKAYDTSIKNLTLHSNVNQKNDTPNMTLQKNELEKCVIEIKVK